MGDVYNELGKIASIYGDVCVRKQRTKRQKLLVLELFLDYAKNSTLHGLRYITEKSLTAIEKLFWIVTFIVSVVLCFYLISNVYDKWTHSPTIVSVNEKLVSVSEVPFPSITICPQIKSKASIYDFSKNLKAFNQGNLNGKSTLEKLADISTVCNFKNNDDIIKKTNRNLTNVNYIKHITDVAPQINDVLKHCAWHQDNILCDSLFSKVYTAEGLCFNMNGISVEEMMRGTVQKDYNYSSSHRLMSGWSLEKEYNIPYHGKRYPLRGRKNGAIPDLSIILTNKPEDSDGLCNGWKSGYKIYLQHPTDFSLSTMFYYAALENQVSSLAVTIQHLTTSAELKKYDATVRQCYFQNQRYLRYFKIYTAQNCEAECLSNYTFEKCGCVGYYMPHDNSSQICAEQKNICMFQVQEDMATMEQELDSEYKGCQCLLLCNSVEYDAVNTRTDFNFKDFLNKSIHVYTNLSYTDSAKFSLIEVYFKKARFMAMKRSEIFSITDFLANIGGLLGLFLGFSFLSLIEIFYFLTLRVGFTLKRDLKQEKLIRTSTIKYKQSQRSKL